MKKDRFDTKEQHSELMRQMKQYVCKYYCERLYSIVNYHKRSELETYFLFTIKNLLLIIIVLQNDILNMIISLDYNLNFIQESLISDLHELDIAFQFNCFTAAFNTFLFFYLLYSFIHFILFEKSKSFSPIQEDNKQQNNGIRRIPTKRIQQNTIENIFSIVFKWYNYILLLPFLHYATIQQDPLSVYALISTVLVGYIVNNCDYEYLITSEEFFQKNFDSLSIGVYFCECLIVSLFNSIDRNIKMSLFCILAAMQIVYLKLRQPIQNNMTFEKYIYFCHFISFFFSLILSIQYNTNSTNSLYIWLLICIPMAYKISNIIVDHNVKTLLEFAQSPYIMNVLLDKYRNKKSELSHQNQLFDRMLRILIFYKEDRGLKYNLKQIIKLNMSTSWCLLRRVIKEEEEEEGGNKGNEYDLSQMSIQFSESKRKGKMNRSFQSSRRQDNNMNNTDRSDRSTAIRKNSSLQRDMLSGGQIDLESDILLNQILLDYFSGVVEGQSAKSKDSSEVNEISIQMLVFILQVVKNYQLFWMKLNQIKKQNLSLKQMQILYTLEVECNKQVRLQLKKHQANSIFYQGFLDVIYFDNIIEEINDMIHKGFNIKMIILDKMKNRNINLTEIFNNISEFLSIRSSILMNIKIANRINKNSKELEKFSIDYNQIISFSPHDLKNSRLSENMQEENGVHLNLQDKYTNYFDQNLDKFSRDTCIIYVSLQKDKKIEINQVSQNFMKMFNYKRKQDIINNPLDILLPSIFQRYHSLFIRDFFEKPMDSILNEQSEQNKQYEQKNKQKNQNKQIEQNKQIDENEESQFLKSMIAGTSCIQTAKDGNKRCLFAVTQDNHLIQVKLDVKINKLTFNNDFGLTAQISQVCKYQDFILFRSDICQVISTTFKIHRKIFKIYSHFNEIKLKKYFSFLKNRAEYNILQNLSQKNDKSEQEREIISIEDQLKQIELLKEKQNLIYRSEFDYILVIRREKRKRQKTFTKNSTLGEAQHSQLSLYNKYSFYKLSLCLKDLKVSHASFADYSLSYLEITSIKRIHPQRNQKVILDVITSNEGQYKTNIHGLSQKYLQILYADLEETLHRCIQADTTNQYQNNKFITQFFSQTTSVNPNQFSSEQADSTSNHSNNNFFINNNNRATSAADFTENQDSLYFSTNLIKQRTQGQSHSLKQENMSQQNSANNMNNKQYQGEQNLDLTNKMSKYNLEDIIEEDQNNSFDNQRNGHFKNNIAHMSINLADINEERASNLNSIHNLDKTKQSKHLDGLIRVQEQSFRSEIHHIDLSIQNESQYQNASTFTFPQKLPSLSQIVHDKKLNGQELTMLSPKIYSDQNLVSVDNFQSPNSNNYNLHIRQMKLQKFQQHQLTGGSGMYLSKSTLKEQNSDISKKFGNNLQSSWQNNEQDKEQNEIEEISDIDEDEDDVTKRKGYKIYSDLTTRQNKFSEDKKKEQLDSSSANSKVSSIEQVKKEFRKTILTKKSHYSLFFVNAFGLISILVIFIVNFQQFFSTKNVLQSVKEDFLIAQWPLNYNNQLYGLIEAFNLKRLTSYNNTNLVYYTTDKSLAKELIENKINEGYSSMKKLLRDLIEYDINRTIVSIIFQYPFQLNLKTDLSASYGVNDPESADYLNCNLGYCLISMQNYIFRYSYISINNESTTASYSEQIFLTNQRPISITLRDLFIKSIDYSKESLEGIKDSLDNLVIIITTISCFCIFLVIPLYAFIQTYREKILSLLTTFSIDIINDIINNIQQYFQSNLDKQMSYRNTQTNDLKSKKGDQKKQNLSFYTKLPKFNTKLILSCLTIFFLMLLYPILNRQFTLSYIDESQQNLQILYVLSRVKSYILLNVGLQYFGLTVKQFPVEEKVFTLVEILSRISTSLDDQVQIQLDLISVMEGTYLKDRHKQEEFNNFFIKIMNSNPCPVLKKYPEYMLVEDHISEEQCQRQFNQNLKNGLWIAIKSFMNTFKDVYVELKEVPPNKLQKINIIDYNEQVVVLVNLLDCLSNFIKQKNEEYYNYIINCQIYLMIYQFFALTVIFYLSWIMFYRFIDNQLHATKLNLSFIHVTNLIQNPYIQSYFQQKNKI